MVPEGDRFRCLMYLNENKEEEKEKEAEEEYKWVLNYEIN